MLLCEDEFKNKRIEGTNELQIENKSQEDGNQSNTQAAGKLNMLDIITRVHAESPQHTSTVRPLSDGCVRLQDQSKSFLFASTIAMLSVPVFATTGNHMEQETS